MSDRDVPASPQQTHALEVVSYLWEEYCYRHDMVWKLAFRVTAVAAALLIAPFLADREVQKRVENGLVALPILAIVVILGGIIVLRSELKHLDHIRKAYRHAQNVALTCFPSEHWTPHPLPQEPFEWRRLVRLRTDDFADRVNAYLLALLVLAVIYCVYFVVVWL